MISESLGIQVSALMGANVANEVAQDMFCETTIGCADQKDQEMYLKLFNTKTFRVSTVSDVYGVEICGSLKNIVALGAGFCDGLSFGGNSKAAIMRIGLLEMKKFAQMFYKGVESETFFESCGVADLITTCVGGRNRKVAEAFVKTGKSWNDLEAELLNGQKLQGTLTCDEVHRFLTKKGKIEEFPLFFTIYLIAQKKVEPLRVFDFDEVTTEFKK
ncbi:glycerol-3-phosphate dehydrogenase [NAD(+)]-related [Anaeramoeba ignava]|nr:glycerol-3-phosphate dehydrogenase [NAD(+)]-related [Anaeramoeba ignava]